MDGASDGVVDAQPDAENDVNPDALKEPEPVTEIVAVLESVPDALAEKDVVPQPLTVALPLDENDGDGDAL